MTDITPETNSPEHDHYADRLNNMSEQQRFYNVLRIHNKELYKLRDMALEAQDIALSGNSSTSFETAQKVNQMSQLVSKAVSTSYRWQKDLERKNPEYKQEAIEYTKSLKQQREMEREQGDTQQSM